MRNLVRFAVDLVKKTLLILMSIKKIYQSGGYSTFQIAKIDYGQILRGKSVLITGGSAGIGFSIAKKFVGEGASVIITGRDKEKLAAAAHEINSLNLRTIVWDAADFAITEQKLNECRLLLNGDIDILVNNAGIVNGAQFPDVHEETYDAIYLINHKSLFFLSQAVYKNWISERPKNLKKIINISSQGGFVGATYPYRMTKWDIAGLTQGLGVKLAPHGVIVNGIAPGIIATAMQPSTLKQGENNFCVLNPLGRFALPDEIAELALFLAGDASNFIIGQTIVCDGGFSIK